MPNVEAREASTLPITETGSYVHTAGDEALSQAMLRILKRVAGLNTGTVGRGSVME